MDIEKHLECEKNCNEEIIFKFAEEVRELVALVEAWVKSLADKHKPHPFAHALVSYGTYIAGYHTENEEEMRIIKEGLSAAFVAGFDCAEIAKKGDKK